MATVVTAGSAIERLARTHPELEVWWDSSPLIFDSWRHELLDRLPAERRATWEDQLARLFSLQDPTESIFVGVTTNPPLSLQAIEKNAEQWNPWIDGVVRAHPQATPGELFWPVYREVVRRGSDFVRPIFEASGQRRGYLSGQVDPRAYADLHDLLRQAITMHQTNPNVMVKMPGTKLGIYGIEILTSIGIPTNCTLAFTVPQMVQVGEAVTRGLARARANGIDLSRWRSVCTMMLGRFEDAKPMKEQASRLGIELTESDIRWAGPAIFKQAYRLYRERGYESKPLAASMRLGPTVDGKVHIRHLEELTGGAVVATIFPNIVEAFLLNYADEEIQPRIEQDPPAEVMEKLLKIPYFRQGYEEDGLEPEQFATHAAVLETSAQFTQASLDLETYIQRRIGAVRA